MSTYLFDNAAAQADERFTSLERCYDHATISRLEALGVAEGWHCLEVGGGGGSIARWLSNRVGESGSVLATDIDPGKMYGQAGNLTIARHDIVNDPLPEATYDLVHARLVLIHVAQRVRVVKRLLRALKPGGWLLLDEFDLTWKMPVLVSPTPTAPALVDKVVDAIHTLLETGGMSRTWAAEAPGALHDAGYVEIGQQGFSEAWPGGSVGAHLHRANILQVGPQLVERGIASQAEVDEFVELLEHPGILLSSYLLLSAWGRRPV